MFNPGLAVATLVCGSMLFPATAAARTQIRAVGSSTVYPFAKAVAERMARSNPKLGVPILESTGTGAGLKLFCQGIGERFPDVANASRRINASETKLCAANGVTQITEIPIGMDGIALAMGKNGQLSGVSQGAIYMAIAKALFGKPNRARPGGT